jgi:hypothetical protein
MGDRGDNKLRTPPVREGIRFFLPAFPLHALDFGTHYSRDPFAWFGLLDLNLITSINPASQTKVCTYEPEFIERIP